MVSYLIDHTIFYSDFECVLVDERHCWFCSYLPQLSTTHVFSSRVVFLRIWGQSSGGSEPSQRAVGTTRFPQAFPKRQTGLWQPAAWPGPAVPALLHGYGHHHQCRGTFIKPWSWTTSPRSPFSGFSQSSSCDRWNIFNDFGLRFWML